MLTTVLLENVKYQNALFILVTEGVHLYNFGIDPYMGDLFHETPIGLYVFNLIQLYLPHWILFILFIFTDLSTALLLALTAKHYATELVSLSLLVLLKLPGTNAPCNNLNVTLIAGV